MQTLTPTTVPGVISEKHTRPVQWAWIAIGAAVLVAVFAALAIVAVAVARDDASPAPAPATVRSANAAEVQLGSSSALIESSTAAEARAVSQGSGAIVGSTTAAEAPGVVRPGTTGSTNPAELRVLPGPR
jgi:hypothetical protein